MLCKELHIDDPIGWMDSVPASLVDLWLAYYLNEQSDQKRDATMMDPAEVNRRLATASR